MPCEISQHKVSRRTFDARFGMPVCGIDEAGRGPLAGPVVTACVYIPPEHVEHPVWQDVNDSKQLTVKKRDFLYELIMERCVYAIAEASAQEIDDLNIHHATLLAMKRAYEGVADKLSSRPEPEAERRDLRSLDYARDDNKGLLALIDGKFIPTLPCKAQAVVKGDSLSLSIAAASILAKVTRDRLMFKLHEEFPHYGWNTNAGYGTAEHMKAIRIHGITPHHRKSYAPCRQNEEAA